MLASPASRSAAVKDHEYDSLDLGVDAKADRHTMISTFKETFNASSVELASTNDGANSLADMLSQWLDALRSGNKGGMVNENWSRAVCRTAMLAATARLDPRTPKELSGVAQFLSRHTAPSGEGQTWDAHCSNS